MKGAVQEGRQEEEEERKEPERLQDETRFSVSGGDEDPGEEALLASLPRRCQPENVVSLLYGCSCCCSSRGEKKKKRNLKKKN